MEHLETHTVCMYVCMYVYACSMHPERVVTSAVQNLVALQNKGMF